MQPIVTLQYYDDADTETTVDDPNGVTTWKYTIETPTALESASVETIMFVPVTSGATCDIIYPGDVDQPRLSSPPLSGTFYASCYNTDGMKYDTIDMDIADVSAKSFKSVLEEYCGFLAGKISVTKLDTTYASNAMGVEFQVNFHGIAATLDLYSLQSGFADPLVGVEVVFDASVVRPFGESLVWHVIPGDYFYTREVLPQVKVDVDGMAALCTGMQCDYSYAEGTSEITDYEVDHASNQLTIFGTDFGTPTKVEMGYLDCGNIVATVNQITCDLADDLPAGSWFPIVTEEMGRVKTLSTVTAEVVDCLITSVSPDIDINPAGGDHLVIQGTNFPVSNDERHEL